MRLSKLPRCLFMPLNRSITALGCFLVLGVTAGRAAEEAKPRDLLHQLDDAFSGVFEKVAPAVVIVEADKRAGVDDRDESFDFFFRPPQGGGRGNRNSDDKTDSDRRVFKMP